MSGKSLAARSSAPATVVGRSAGTSISSVTGVRIAYRGEVLPLRPSRAAPSAGRNIRIYDPSSVPRPVAGGTTIDGRPARPHPGRTNLWQQMCGSATAGTRRCSRAPEPARRPTPTASTSTCAATKVSAAEVDDAACRARQRADRALGVRPGDRVAIAHRELGRGACSPGGASCAAGAIAVPINTAYKGEYLRHQLADSGARVADRRGRPRRPGRRASRRAARALEHVVVLGDERRVDRRRGQRTPGPSCSTADAADPGVERAARRTSPPSSTPAAPPGPSKGCMLSHNYHEALARQIGICWGRTADDVVWTPLPLFHFNAIVTAVLGPLVFGGRAAIYRRFSVSNFWPEMNRTGRHHHLHARHDGLPAGPRRRPARDAAVGRARGQHHRCASSARRRCRSRSTTSSASRFGVETFSGAYGVTEASLISWQPPGVRNKPNAAGVVNDEYFDVRIFDDDDNELPRGHRRRDRHPPEAPRTSCSRATGAGPRPPSRPAATGGTTPATSAGSTTTASSSSSTARPTTCAAGARTSRASRSSASSWATARSPTSPCTPCRAS